MSAPSTSAHAYVVDAASYDAETQSRETNVYVLIHVIFPQRWVRFSVSTMSQYILGNSHMSHVALQRRRASAYLRDVFTIDYYIRFHHAHEVSRRETLRRHRTSKQKVNPCAAFIVALSSTFIQVFHFHFLSYDSPISRYCLFATRVMGKRPLETLCNLLEINRTSLFLITEMVTRGALLVEKKQSYGGAQYYYVSALTASSGCEERSLRVGEKMNSPQTSLPMQSANTTDLQRRLN